jgi:hypothetical protein
MHRGLLAKLAVPLGLTGALMVAGCGSIHDTSADKGGAKHEGTVSAIIYTPDHTRCRFELADSSGKRDPLSDRLRPATPPPGHSTPCHDGARPTRYVVSGGKFGVGYITRSKLKVWHPPQSLHTCQVTFVAVDAPWTGRELSKADLGNSVACGRADKDEKTGKTFTGYVWLDSH